MSIMHLDIVSAEEEIFSGNVKNIIAAAMMGEVGIYPQHTPMITPLKPGEIKEIFTLYFLKSKYKLSVKLVKAALDGP